MRRRAIGAEAQAGAASVEYSALIALAGLAAALIVLAVGAGPARRAPDLLARRIACSAALPGPCSRDPLLEAYGPGVAHAVRRHAPAPEARSLVGVGGLMPVDFRRCRRPSCAAASGSPRLTVANRRTTAFTLVEDDRRTGRGLAISYFLYRPGLGWEVVNARVGSVEARDPAGERLTEDRDPALVPIETLPGRNHHPFSASEEPPWRWRVTGSPRRR